MRIPRLHFWKPRQKLCDKRSKKFNSMSEINEKTFFSKNNSPKLLWYADCIFDDTATSLAERQNIFALCPKMKKKFIINFSSKSSIGSVECSFDKPAPNFKAKAKIYVFNVRDGQKYNFS